MHKKLPSEYDKCMVALNLLQRKAWEISENPQTEEKIGLSVIFSKGLCDKQDGFTY
jgi:hypothetical protein